MTTVIAIAKNPTGFVDSVESFFSNPVGTVTAGAKATWNAFVSGGPQTKGQILGSLIPGVAFAVATAGTSAIGTTATDVAAAEKGATVANATRGWKVGNPINNLTSKGNVPSWSTVRARYWKNEAAAHPATYSAANLARMQKGLAPQRINPATGALESMELHHTPSQQQGGLFDVQMVWPDEHATIDPFRNTGN